MQDIGTLGGTSANANAINNNDEMAGRSLLANGAIRAFKYSEGVMTDLGTLGGASSVAFDINDRGDVVWVFPGCFRFGTCISV
jgi:probable HAF family extracellular repeat protein